ncbi:MAG TPA: hypothetical protein VLC98_08260 [Phnomibacter sp.]|nr:hypothetical protein [Phnomibacter sp.]
MRQSCIIQIITVLGANLGGTNGSAAISNIGKNTGTNTGNLSASVTAITNPGTAMLGIFCTNQNSTITGTKAGWIVVSDEKVNPGDASSNLVGTTNTYDGVAVATAAASNWAGIALKVEPADVYNNFPCSSIITATNNQNFSIPAQQTICIAGGTATGLTASLTHDAAVLVVKSGTPSFSNVTISKHAEMVIDKDPNAAATTTVSFPNGLDLQDSSNLFIANGAKVIVNGDLTLSGNGGNVRVFGELEVTGNVTIANFKSAFFVGLLAKLTIGGTMRLSSGKVLINGGQLKVNTLEINGSTSIEMSQNAKLEATIFNKNSQLNSFVTGPGGGCLGMVGPNGELAQNGFQPLTNSSALKVCLPSSGVTIASNFTTSLKGSATVTTNCASCDIILGGGPLPITLTRFDGNMLSTGESHLAWSVANNNDVSSFAIEYSTNGRQFEQVASLQKAISSNYQLQHTSTHNGLIYYRLLLIDKQGKSTYSRIITLLHGSEKNTRIIGLSPTVTTNNAKLELYAATGQTIAYTIIDAAAHRVKTEKKTVQKGLQQLNIDVHGLPPGLLFIKIQTQDGEQGTMKIMKL